MIVLESNQNHARAEDTEICPCLPASMGMGGGYVPMIVQTVDKDEVDDGILNTEIGSVQEIRSGINTKRKGLQERNRPDNSGGGINE